MDNLKIIDVKEQIWFKKCKVSEAVNSVLHGHYTHLCTVCKAIGINTENKICIPKM